MEIFRLSTTCMKINQIPSHFSNHVFTWILHQLSVSWHLIPLKFSSEALRFGQQESIKLKIFRFFECFDESSPNSSCQFWNHKVKVYSNFVSPFSVTKDNSSLFFYLKPLYFGQKETIEVKFSDFWVLGENSPNFLCHIWNYKPVFV